jgi:hypothetical protein
MHSKWQCVGHIVGISVGTPVVGGAIVVAVVVVTLGFAFLHATPSGNNAR